MARRNGKGRRRPQGHPARVQERLQRQRLTWGGVPVSPTPAQAVELLRDEHMRLQMEVLRELGYLDYVELDDERVQVRLLHDGPISREEIDEQMPALYERRPDLRARKEAFAEYEDAIGWQGR